MTTPGRHRQIIERIMGLTGCGLRDITLNKRVAEFIANAEHGRIGTLIFKGWTFNSFPSHRIQAQQDNEPAVEF